MFVFYPGQRVCARDGAQYVLVCHAEGSWWGVRAGLAMPCPVEPLYPAWGGDDDASGRDHAVASHMPRGRGGRRVPRTVPPRVAT